jgi:hypothetical protein
MKQTFCGNRWIASAGGACAALCKAAEQQQQNSNGVYVRANPSALLMHQNSRVYRVC